MAMKIVVLGTGGTISGEASVPGDNVGYRAGERSIQSLLAGLVSQDASSRLAWKTEQIAQIDSKDADFDLWTALFRRCSVHLADPEIAAIVVTHGTDTLEETAWFLANVLPATKPIVLTCAMRPASALSPDGPQNLLDSFALAQWGLGIDGDCSGSGNRISGVCVVCAGQVHAPRHVQKVHPYRLDAFSSGESGPVGWVEEGALRLAQPGGWPRNEQTAVAFDPPKDARDWPWVEIVRSHSGARAKGVEALVAAGVQGLVVGATGNGTLHQLLEGALRVAAESGVPVRVTSKCASGAIVGQPSHGLRLAERGLSPEKARVSLILELLAQ